MDKRLENRIKEADDKLSVFANKDELNQYDFKMFEILELIKDYLTDEEKAKLFDFSHFQTLATSTKLKIIEMIRDSNLKLQLLSRDEVTNDIPYELISKFDDDTIKKVLYNEKLLSKCDFYNFEVKELIESRGEKLQFEILTNTKLMKEKLDMSEKDISKMAQKLPSDEEKIKIMEIYQFENEIAINIIGTFNSNTRKVDIVLEENRFEKNDKIAILNTLDMESLIEFLRENKEFCRQNDIQPYEITFRLNQEQQKEVITKLEDMDLTLSEKRKILATLDEEVKRSIAMTNLPEEYKSAINIKTMKKSEEALIILDLDRNLEDYKGLDDLIIIEPAKFDEEKRKNLLQLCDICPNLKVENVLYNDEESSVKFDSTATEYKEAEEWISEIIDNINSEYTKAQKMAIIDNAIGKKISYAPDFGTEIWNTNDSRALWKAISKGYGVCNGIAKIEQYMLRRVGIESEIVSSKSHAFLKVKDMKLQFANGETKTGNTILDPTWNLTGHRFGGRPGNFCISYEEARANDVDGKGIDHHSHDNDEDLQDATLSLDDESLRKLYTSVGLADKDGKFPITDFMQKSKALDEEYANNPEENLKNQFSLLAKRCPEFATCQNLTMTALKDIIFDNDNLKCFDRCVINRVYNKQDEEKRPVVFVYVESEEVGKKFYFADKTEGQFIELPEEEFTKQFECYEKDKENHKGLRLWEPIDTEENIDLSKSSGKVVAQESEER